MIPEFNNSMTVTSYHYTVDTDIFFYNIRPEQRFLLSEGITFLMSEVFDF